MKKSIVLFIVLFAAFSANSYSQTCHWAKKIHYINNEDLGLETYGIATDPESNTYIAGMYAGDDISFDDDVILPFHGDYDGFLTKYNASGKCLWAISIHGSGNESINSIVRDNAGNIYLLGTSSSDTLNFSKTNFVVDTAVVVNKNYSFIVKYNSDGIFQWYSKVGEDCYPTNLKLDQNGNIVVAGFLNTSDTVVLGNNVNLVSRGDNDGFIVKYNSTGTCLWAQNIGGKSKDRVYNISADSIGNIYVEGIFTSDTAYFNNKVELIHDNLNLDKSKHPSDLDTASLFIAQYNGDGLCQWAKQISSFRIAMCTGMIGDNAGNLYIYGYIADSAINFNNGISVSGANTGTNACFFAKYNSDGLCLWAKKIQGNISDRLYDVTLDKLGNPYLSGYSCSDTLQFGDNISFTTNFSSTNITSMFFAKYNREGLCLWEKNVENTSGISLMRTCIDDAMNVYISSDHSNYSGKDPEVDFGNNISINEYRCNFIVKYSMGLADVEENSAISNSILVYPNPASEYIDISLNNSEQVVSAFMLYNELGELALEVGGAELSNAQNRIKLGNLPQGAYRAVLKTNSCVFTKAVAIVK